MTTYTFTFFSYLIFLLTLPLTYWFFVKKLGEFDRLVVFRLGKMIGEVLVFTENLAVHCCEPFQNSLTWVF